MFPLLFTPLGRYILAGGLAVILIGGAYLKIRADAIASVEARAVSDALRRTQDAVRAGDAVDLSADRLRDDDGHRRD